MDERTRKNAEQTANDLMDRMIGCDPDSEDYVKYADRAATLMKILNEEKKIESEKEVELKKIEASKSISKKDLFTVGVPIAAGGFGLIFRSWVLRNQLKDITEFETENTYTSSAGRWIVGTLRDIFNFNRRGH